MRKKIAINHGYVDKGLLLLTIALAIFGVVMVYDASSASAYKDFGDKLYYARNQSLWFVIGIIAMGVLSRVDYHWLTKMSFFILSLSTIFLILVLVPGMGTSLLGAKRWITLFGFNFQPAELTKIAAVLFFARIMRTKPKLPIIAAVLLALGVLIMLEPDLGTTVVIVGSGFILYFVAGARIHELILAVPVILLISAGLIINSEYRRSRILTFLNHQSDPLGTSYQVRQILLALGSGGISGLGLGQSRQKYLFLPEVATDSIFAVVAEELGFIGAVTLILMLLGLFLRGLKIAWHAPDREGMLLATGIVSFLAVQTIINLGAMVSLLPLTGVPLPFISYGGSSLVVSLNSIGILLNISRQTKEC